jgi:hypothetical protein
MQPASARLKPTSPPGTISVPPNMRVIDGRSPKTAALRSWLTTKMTAM